MRTRAADWLNTETMRTMFGFQVYHEGRWRHVAENGKPLIYETREARDDKRAEYRKRRSLT